MVVSRRLLLPAVLAILLYGLALPLPAGEETPSTRGSIPSYTSATFPISTEVAFEIEGRSGRRVIALEGIGTVLFGRYVLTVAHAATWTGIEEGLRSRRDRTVSGSTPRKLEETTYLILADGPVRLSPLVSNVEADVALFGLPESVSIPPIPCSIGDSDSIPLGKSILLIERDATAGPIVRPASIAALRGTDKTATLAPPDQTFLLTLGLVSGESGSPLIVVGDRSCELVGLAQGTYVGARQLAWGIRIREALVALWNAPGSPRPETFFRAVCDAAVRPESFPFCS